MSKGFQTADTGIQGETISRDYLNRYAQFSKAAHFTLGNQSKCPYLGSVSP